MSTTTNVEKVKLNIMTQAQYNSATKNANELYMITDALTGTVTSVNNTNPDSNGNVTLSFPVTDIQVNSTSIVTSGVANIPIASTTDLGLVKVYTNKAHGLQLGGVGVLQTAPALESELIAKTQGYKVVVPSNLDIATREGLGNNTLTWTDTYKANARNTIGAGQTTATFVDWINS